MSYVTNVILHAGLNYMPYEDEEDVPDWLKDVNSFFKTGRGFRMLQGSSVGGTKVIECSILVGAFTTLVLTDFINHLETNVRWERTTGLQLIIKDQYDDVFRIQPINPGLKELQEHAARFN